MLNIKSEVDEDIIVDILDECNSAIKSHGEFASAHEMYAVLLEEVEEV